MSSEKLWAVAVIAVCAVCTLFERAFPFLIFRGKKVPPPVVYLGKVLPMAIITTLIFYCIRGIDFHTSASFAPQLISCVLTAVLHLWKGNTMLSIVGGTVCCMVLTQFVF